jgi:hypothetical protein
MNLFQRRALRLEGFLVEGNECSYVDEYGLRIRLGPIGSDDAAIMSDDAAIMRAFPAKVAAKVLETTPAFVEWRTKFDPEENWTEREDVVTAMCLR